MVERGHDGSQTRCLYGVRAAFELMHNDLDPLSISEPLWLAVYLPAHESRASSLASAMTRWCLAAEGAPGADGEHAAAPAVVAPKQLAAAEKEQMRKADRIIMSVLQKVTTKLLGTSASIDALRISNADYVALRMQYPMPVESTAAVPAYVPQDSAVPSSGDGQAGRAEPAADSVSMPSAI